MYIYLYTNKSMENSTLGRPETPLKNDMLHIFETPSLKRVVTISIMLFGVKV